MRFRDRVDAGERLAARLEELSGQEIVVYAPPRGGAVLGAIVASRLPAPLDLVITRKIGHPLLAEDAIGAITEDGDLVGNMIRREVDELVALDIPMVYLGAVGAYCDDFSAVEDDAVIRLMHPARSATARIPERV